MWLISMTYPLRLFARRPSGVHDRPRRTIFSQLYANQRTDSFARRWLARVNAFSALSKQSTHETLT
jgi:hypothetical protein